MMSILPHFFYRAVSTSDPGSPSTEDLPLFKPSETAKHVTTSASSPPPHAWNKRRKLPFVIRILSLVSALAFTIFFGRAFVAYTAQELNAFLRSSNTHSHAGCGQEVSVDGPISIAAPPFKDPPIEAKPLIRKDWALTCSTTKDKAHDCGLAIDGKESTYWQSADVAASAAHWIVIDLKQKVNVHSVAVRPGRDWDDIAGSVRKHRVQTATELGKWELVALGTWRAHGGENYATFEPRLAQYVNLTVIETTDKKSFVAIGDINVYTVEKTPAPVDRGGRWNITLNFPSVPVTAFLNPKTNDLITMAADKPDHFAIDQERLTVSATWVPTSEMIEERIIAETGHDMFCPGTSYDENGKVIFTGGSTPDAFSIYDPVAKVTWSTPKNKTTGADMKLQIARGYQGQTFLPSGKTFMIGGTWSGGEDKTTDRDGELYDPTTGAWKVLHNIKAGPIKMDVSQSCQPPNHDKPCTMDEWRQHHPWLFAWKNDSIFHAGPSKKMNWFFTAPPEGAVKDGGFRKDKDTGFADGDAVCGVTSMYDAEKGLILTAGGAPNYHYWFDPDHPEAGHRQEATNNAFEIELGKSEPGTIIQPKRVTSMTYQRIFANAVILPTGETLVVGGQRQGEPFHDETWQPVPEIYNPDTKQWSDVARHSTPRVYHSWALLLPDATVIVGGGGLARAVSDHYDAQIYQPSYLFTPDGKDYVQQPKIKTIDKQVYKIGQKITFTTDVEVDAVASLIRYGATTHALNNDMRRIKLAVTKEGGAAEKKYSVVIPNDAGVALPGFWMLFVLAKGVPSHAETVQILV